MTQTNFSEYDPGTVFLYFHDYVWSPFLVIGHLDLYTLTTYYINQNRVLKRKWDLSELEDDANFKIVGHIDLTRAILDILEKRGKDATRLLDVLFNYAREQNVEANG